MKRFRPRWRDRYQDRMKNFLTRTGWAIAIILAGYGLWYSVSTVRNHNHIVAQAEARAMKAEANLHEAHEILAGRYPHMRTEGKDYYEFANITWTAAKVEGR